MHRGVYRGKSWLHRLEEKGMGASTSAQAAETEHAHAPASFKCKNAQNVCSSIPFHQHHLPSQPDPHRAQAKDLFTVKKVCITKSVIFGLLKQASEGGGGGSIVEVPYPSKQVYEDGTLFRVKDFRALCMVLMHTYMELYKEPGFIVEQMHVRFLGFAVLVPNVRVI